MNKALKRLAIFLSCLFILTSCSIPPKRPAGVWTNEDKTIVIDFADGYNCDDMSCSVTVGEEETEYDICFAVVEQNVSLGELSYSEDSENSEDTVPVFYDEITFSYSYSKDKLTLKVISSSNEHFSVGSEFVLSMSE